MRTFSKIQQFLLVVTIAALAITVVSYFLKDNLPAPDKTSPLLKNDPVQTPTNVSPFKITKEKVEYQIKPLYDYELYGLIVSVGNNLGWFSRFKDTDPLNTNDICLIWGSNIDSGVYQKMEFYSQEFFCNYKYSGIDISKFKNDKISNNHLILDKEKNPGLFQKIRNARPGDQIHFKGYLANYSIKSGETISGTRVSSTIRDDTGNGACEVVYVTDFEILKRNPNIFSDIFQYSKYALIFGGGLWLFLFIFSIFLPNKAEVFDEELPETIETFSQSLPSNLSSQIKDEGKTSLDK